MRKLYPNEDGLDTVLEVPIPEEMFMSNSKDSKIGCTNMKAWMWPHADRCPPSPVGRGPELQLMLSVIGAPLVPLPIHAYQSHLAGNNIKNDPIDVSMAKYIIQQYIAATGGDQALNSIKSMYAMGKVRMTATEIPNVNGTCNHAESTIALNNKKTKKSTNIGGEMGGFVLWKKKPELWCLEIMVSGYKMSAGSDGKVAWRQTPWNNSHASRGPLCPLRRFFQISRGAVFIKFSLILTILIFLESIF